MPSLILAMMIGAIPNADTVARYRSAVELYEAGRIEEAAAIFETLSHEPGPLQPLAFYALGNLKVEDAVQSPTNMARNQKLQQAIEHYRQSLDQADGTALDVEAARHNLELAKRLLHWPSPGSEPGARRLPTSAQRTEINDNRDDGPEDPSSEKLPPPEESPSASSPTSAPVTKSKGGLAPTDPGPLTIEQANKRLATAVQRIEQEQQRQLKLRPYAPRLKKGDY